MGDIAEEFGVDVKKTICWPSPGCHCNCGLLVRVKDNKILDIKGNPEFPYNRGRVCTERMPHFRKWLDHPDQRMYPLKRKGERGENRWERISWEQALWTMAREKADVTVVLLNNSSYAILNVELARVGAGKPNEKTLAMFDLNNPAIDWVALSRSMGVPAGRATTADAFHRQFEEAMKMKGPHLIEAFVPVSLGKIFQS